MNITLPAISGQATEGQTLGVQPGTWTGAAPISYAYQWQRCDTAGNNCANIGGATGPTYVPQAADVAKTMRLVVVATNNEGSRSATSGPTAVVAKATTPSVLAVSAVSLPERLVIRGVQFEPSPIRSRSEPLIVRFRVTTTKGIPVSGALVFARGVPSNRVSAGAERATGSDGWVEFTFQPLRALPLVRGATLVMFVRARKPNDDLLAGVSTRRLVQVRVNPFA
jgi:hypothetical protein